MGLPGGGLVAAGSNRWDSGEIRVRTPEPPSGWERMKWYGPGLLWMISSVGSGSTLFTPRIGSRYGYVLLWVIPLVSYFMWVMIHEVARYSVVTGKSILDGYRGLPGPRNWAVWFILLPQVVSGVVLITGIAALLGSVLMISLPGSQRFYAIALVLVSGLLVAGGKYQRIERICRWLSAVLVITAVAAAFAVFPQSGEILSGLTPALPEDADLYFILPWIGFILAGAAGIMWYSYWTGARGYGGALQGEGEGADESGGEGGASAAGPDPERVAEKLRVWLRIMAVTSLTGVVGGTLVILSFLILGAELLRPEGIVPEGVKVAEDLTHLFSEIWGDVGRWILLMGYFVALWGTIIADQDGWGRMYANGTLMLFPRVRERLGRARRSWFRRMAQPGGLKKAYILVLLMVLPVLILLILRDPVRILSIGGIITAVHTPVVVAFTLYLNKKSLPVALRPNWIMSLSMVASGLFYGGFGLLYFYDLFLRS